MTKDRLYFEALYARFNDSTKLDSDPLVMVSSDLRPEDFELVSFIVAGLSYGRVEQIQKSVADLFLRLSRLGLGSNGAGLAKFLRNSENSRVAMSPILRGWVHRMNTHRDLLDLFEKLSLLLKKHHSLCRCYQSFFRNDAKAQLSLFCAELGGSETPAKKPKVWRGTGASWFACSPESGSTCKRLMMWFRWMLRKDEIDPGTWHELFDPQLPAPSAARLFWPIDTHIFQWAKREGILKRQSPSWKAVEELTSYFQKICPEDPVRYDFAICHEGMEKIRSRPLLTLDEL